MSSYNKCRQRCCNALVVLVIVLLLALVAFMWKQVKEGAFRPQEDDIDIRHLGVSGGNKELRLNSVMVTSGDGDSRVGNVQRDEADLANDGWGWGYGEGSGSASWKRSRDKESSKVLLDNSHLNDVATSDTEENIVKPLKISPPPLHHHDILYDRTYNNQNSPPPLRHHNSGHFRPGAAQVWDPHPQYEIRAFGEVLRLRLTFNAAFLPDKLPVHTIEENYTQMVLHDSAGGCFYTGLVQGDSASSVAVSLCNGMTGYIKTHNNTYLIEPMEHFKADSVTSTLHRIKKIPHQGVEPEFDNNVVIESDGDCDTHITEDNVHTPPIITDDLQADEPVQHGIFRRHLSSINDDKNESNLDSFLPHAETHTFYRTARDTSWIERLGSNNIDYGDSQKRAEFFIEILVVTDQSMLLYHKNGKDLQHYILTLMSHVALLYKDATIGNPISLAVVHISILKNIEFESETAEEMLRKFCEWKQKNLKIHQHDTALLLTRKTLCKNPAVKLCNTLGVAEVGSMCSPNTSCAVVKDKGLSTSFTIAHELGHILSMPHDEDKMCAKFTEGATANNVMTKMLQNGRKPWHWSPCSKYYLTEFLNSNRAHCLLESPNKNYLAQDFHMFPGENFEVDKQCELEFGVGAKICSYMPICSSLWCATEQGEQEGCRSQHMPWADGTKCGNGSWCHHGECIALDRQSLNPVKGGWGPWQAWGTCARTCGGGVKQAKRDCNAPEPAHGGAYCMGSSIRYSSCNTESCEKDVMDFRDMQCAEFNGNTKGIQGLSEDVTWLPKHGMHQDDECKLYCRVNGSSLYFMLKEKVIDGTKCNVERFDICVNGLCRKAGCDNQLNSNMTLDECGECGGDNSRCEAIFGTYNKRQYGYSKIITIPKGSANIVIRQRGKNRTHIDENYLALVDPFTGEYFLNGNFIVAQHSKDFIYGDLHFEYSGSDNGVEEIRTRKLIKLTRDLVVEVLSVGKIEPPDVTFNYTISREHSPRFGWRLFKKNWEQCNSICSGMQFIYPDCFELATDRQVPDDNCRQYDRASHTTQKECNTQCELVWSVSNKGHCNAHCGRGYRQISYHCMKIDKRIQELQIINADSRNYQTYETVDDKHCSYISKPVEYETCDGPCDDTRWNYEAWSECSKSCGGGVQRRVAVCIDNNSKVIDDNHCKDKDTIIMQSCNAHKCPTWFVDDWKPCSASCGQGYRYREYYCHVGGRILPNDRCSSTQMPAVQESCPNLPACTTSTSTTTTTTTTTVAAPSIISFGVRWVSGNWSSCSVSCGQGKVIRMVECRTYDGEAIDEGYCEELLKPNATKRCALKDCIEEYFVNSLPRHYDKSKFRKTELSQSEFHWTTGSWSECTRSCGNTGTSTRPVHCLTRSNGMRVHAKHCADNNRPTATVSCNQYTCPQWRTDSWSSCSSECEQRRRVACVDHTDRPVGEDECEVGERPMEHQQCGEECVRMSEMRWRTGKWSECSKPCGGIKNRLIWCEDISRNIRLVDGYCNQQKKPITSKKCTTNACRLSWIEAEWSPCSASCGTGTQDRTVTCHRMRQGFPESRAIESTYSKSARHTCDMRNKPIIRQKCLVRHCSDEYSWRTEQWQRCNRPCGRKGRQVRKVLCTNLNGQLVRRDLCPKALKPQRKRKCNQRRCFQSCTDVRISNRTRENGEYTIEIRGKPVNIYCYKMETRDPVEYVTLHDTSNYAEFYNKRLIDSAGCPNYGQRDDNCHCLPVDSVQAGITEFYRVRLNVTTLRIIADDYTFTRTKGKQIPFGTAGDCYSEQFGCPQGKFSVDLSRTSFKLAPTNKWIHTGHKSSSVLDIKENSASGQCGGYCGHCLPDPTIGLLVDIT